MNDDDEFPEHLALKIVADLLVFQLGADHQPIKMSWQVIKVNTYNFIKQPPNFNLDCLD